MGVSAIKREERIGGQRLLLGDCLEVMKELGRFDAVVTDPPYLGVKRDAWDNQWSSDAAFIEWVGQVRDHLRGLLNSNGSLYWFASPQMAARVEVALSEKFRILNNLVWDKSGARKGVAGTGIDVTALRCFWSASTERVIFAEPSGSDQAAADAAGYNDSCVAAKASIFGDYLRQEFARAGVKNKQIAALFPSKTGGLTGCVSNWLLGLNVPTPEQYAQMREFLHGEYLKREYEDLKREYEDLKREYEDLRRPFNVSAEDEWGDVWRFDIERGTVHPTQKPLSLMRHIVKASSKDGGGIIDPFMGSGTTLVACQQMGRMGTGIELDPEYFDIACKRVDEATRQPDMFVQSPVESVKQEELF